MSPGKYLQNSQFFFLSNYVLPWIPARGILCEKEKGRKKERKRISQSPNFQWKTSSSALQDHLPGKPWAGEGAEQSGGKQNYSLMENFLEKLSTAELGNCKVLRQPLPSLVSLATAHGDEARWRSGGAGRSCRSSPHSVELTPTIFFIYNLIIRKVRYTPGAWDSDLRSLCQTAWT